MELRVLSDDHATAFREHILGALDARRAADQAIDNPPVRRHLGLADDDCVLDVRAGDPGVLADGRVGTDVAPVLDRHALGDRRGAAHDRPAFDRGRLGELDAAAHLGTLLDGTVERAAPAFEHEPVRFEDVFGLAGVLPPPLDDVRVDLVAVVEQQLNSVGDLEFPPPRGFEAVDRVEDGRREHVDADEREVARRVVGLFDQSRDVSLVVDLRDSELPGIVDVLEGDTRPVVAGLEAFDQFRDPLVQDVVAEVHDEVVVADELPCTAGRMREPERIPLDDVRDVDAVLRPVTDEVLDLLAAEVPEDDPDLGDTGLLEVLDGVLQDRLVRDRDELFRSGVRDRPEPRSSPAREDDALHRQWSCSSQSIGILSVSGGKRSSSGSS